MQSVMKTPREAEQGYVLVGLIVAIFIILLVLGVAAPKVARGLRREQEVEAIHRGNQYVRAVQLYYRKNGHYPGSIEQLEKANNIRYLRQRYVDPMTGKPDWKLIHVGEAKTTVKGFFGKPLSGLPGASGGLGSAAGMSSGIGIGAGGAGTAGSSSFGSSSFGSPGAGSGSSFGSSGSSSFGSSSFGSSSSPSTSSPTGTGAGSGSTDPGTGSSTSGSSGSTGITSQSATSFTGTGAPIMGVGTAATGNSITVLNEQTTYPTWEFIYDPRIEQLKAKASLLGGGPASTDATSLGSGSTTPGGGTAPGVGGTSSGSTSGFGSSSFGPSSFGSGSSGGTTTPPSNTPQ